MTDQEKMKFVVEKTGGCWHKLTDHLKGHICLNCGETFSRQLFMTSNSPNPSPDDLNALFELAEKVGWRDIVLGETADGDYFADIINSDSEVMIGNSRSEALLTALWKVLGGSDE